MTSQGGLAAATVTRERLPRWFAALATVYFGFLAVFVPLKQFPIWVKHAPGSAVYAYLVIVAVAVILGCYRGSRLALYLDWNGVTVRNYFRTYRIGWSEVKCFADGNAGLQTSRGFAWALSVMSNHDRRPVVAVATTRYSGARPETLAAIREHAELLGIAVDLTGVARRLRPRRRNFVGDMLLWMGIILSVYYLLGAAGVNTAGGA
jgi:hypothetical protein